MDSDKQTTVFEEAVSSLHEAAADLADAALGTVAATKQRGDEIDAALTELRKAMANGLGA